MADPMSGYVRFLDTMKCVGYYWMVGRKGPF